MGTLVMLSIVNGVKIIGDGIVRDGIVSVSPPMRTRGVSDVRSHFLKLNVTIKSGFNE